MHIMEIMTSIWLKSSVIASQLALQMHEVKIGIISYNMGSSALPDMYARSPRAAGPRAEGIHIRQSTSAHVITNMLHFWHS